MFISALILATLISTKADVPRVSPAELQQLTTRGEAIVVDVRGSVPYELGHIAGAVWMPLGLLDQRSGELPQDKLLVTYCTCKAEETSLEAAMRLSQLGFEKVAVLHGGYPAWKEAGLPVEAAAADEAAQPEGAAAGRSGRLAPPAAVSCNRSHLTAYAGTPTRYERKKGATTITIATTSDTVETVKLSHPGSDDPSRFFLIEGTPMTARDWNRIESKKGTLHPNVRVIAWVCDDGKTIVDFRKSAGD